MRATVLFSKCMRTTQRTQYAHKTKLQWDSLLPGSLARRTTEWGLTGRNGCRNYMRSSLHVPLTHYTANTVCRMKSDSVWHGLASWPNDDDDDDNSLLLVRPSDERDEQRVAVVNRMNANKNGFIRFHINVCISLCVKLCVCVACSMVDVRPTRAIRVASVAIKPPHYCVHHSGTCARSTCRFL